jgi:hypothetical protein
MDFKVRIPDKWLPKSLQSDVKAAEIVNKKGRRVSAALVKQRPFIAALQQDELKNAILFAEDPDRPRRDLLYEVYRQAMRDAHFTGEYEKAINKVVGSAFGVFMAGTDEIDALATRLLTKAWFEEYRTHYEESDVFWGHGVVQFLDLEKSDDEGINMQFKKIDLIDRPHVRPEEGWIVLDINDEKGIPFRDPVIAKALKLIEMGKPNNLGKLQIIAREYIWKMYSRSDWSRHSEKFGMPFIQIKTNTSDTAEVAKLEEMASQFGNNLWAIVDNDDDIQIKEASFKDSYQIYKEKANFCNSEISKATTWQTGTSDEKAYVGSSKVHADILDDYTQWRKRKQTFHINDVLFPFLIENGYPLKGREFRYITYKESDTQQDEDEQNEQQQNGAGGRSGKKSDGQQAKLYKYRALHQR